MQGADRQRLKAVEEALARHASAESVGALAGRMDELEHDLKQIAAALSKVAVVETKLDGLDRLMTRELDEIKHSLRGIQARGFDPPATRSRRAAPG